jgi:phosphoglucomutase
MEGNLKRNDTVSPMAGKPASQEMLVDVTRLEREYFERLPDIEDPNQLVSFGTTGHRGSSLRDSFNESHVRAITQAICDYRRTQGTNGPLSGLMNPNHYLSVAIQYLLTHRPEWPVEAGVGKTLVSSQMINLAPE